MDWLFEGDSTVYLFLGVALIITAAIWWKTRRPEIAIAAVIVLAFIGLYWLLDVLVVTDRERIVDNIQAMSKAVGDKNIQGIFTHVADDFDTHGLNKQRLRQLAELNLKSGEVTRIAPSDVQPLQVSRAKKTGQIEFLVKVEGNFGTRLMRCKATFGLEGDGAWRLKTFQLFEPQKEAREGTELSIP